MMVMKKLISVLFVMIMLLSVVSALQIESGDELFLTEEVDENLFAVGGEVSVDSPVNGDAMIFGGNINIDSEVTGDAELFGGNVWINSEVEGDLFVGAGNIYVKSNINEDAKMLAGNIEVSGDIAGDLLAAGGTIKVNNPIGGDVAIAGGKITLNSDIAGDVEIDGGEVVIRGIIDGDVTIKADKIKLGDRALIKGNLNYTSPIEPEFRRDQVKGEIFKNIVAKKKVDYGSLIVGKILGLLSLLMIGILLTLIMPSVANKLSGSVKERFWKNLLFGFAALVVVPIAAIAIAITVIGIPVSLILIGLYILALYIAKFFVALYIGKLILKKQKGIVKPMIIGLIVYTIIVNIPYIGGWISFLALLIGLGAMTTMTFNAISNKKKTKR